MVAVSKYVYTDNPDKIVGKYNKTYPRTSKIKPSEFKVDTYIYYGINHNDKRKLKI